jgi:type VI secretion system protein ImpA
MGGRANAISWFDAQASLAIMGVPFTGSAGYSYLDWEDSKVYDLPDNLESLPSAEQTRLTEQKAAAEAKGKVTGDAWKREIIDTRRASCEVINFAVEECWAEFQNLNRVIEEKYDRNQMPGLSALQKSLDTVHTQIKKLLDQKRAEEPDPIEPEEPVETGADGSTVAAGANGVGSPTGAIQNRRDALRRLADIADFFQKTEPHSPLSYLINRAVKWGNMPLESWLKDVIKDESVLAQIHQTLGFNTNNGDDSANQ